MVKDQLLVGCSVVDSITQMVLAKYVGEEAASDADGALVATTACVGDSVLVSMDACVAVGGGVAKLGSVVVINVVVLCVGEEMVLVAVVALVLLEFSHSPPSSSSSGGGVAKLGSVVIINVVVLCVGEVMVLVAVVALVLLESSHSPPSLSSSSSSWCCSSSFTRILAGVVGPKVVVIIVSNG